MDYARIFLLIGAFSFVGCSDETLNLFFDIPPPTEAEKAAAAARKAQERAETARASGEVIPVDEGPAPAIEAAKTWGEAEAMLPKDDLGQVDWAAALEQGIIRPRQEITGPRLGQTAVFKFDFYLPGPDPSFDAFFPHSVHTEWLACESCHPKIFPRRGTQIAMDDVFAGEYCGKCHGNVAFAADSCARCHTQME